MKAKLVWYVCFFLRFPGMYLQTVFSAIAHFFVLPMISQNLNSIKTIPKTHLILNSIFIPTDIKKYPIIFQAGTILPNFVKC